ncbi:type II toxin-antitoxin system RelE/ParE family toxin [Arvimicrobium flavum]|uniref:type II toxin-antitoxin system RelE/ParE family toxin n=1 Tax=Arvimicrobium flavum TaxID=3393320 RepID=UPI00237A868F|nr:type II toxin-antitoxin system RelE/ParE family toxin [Mesorhizobium shangrilense]
MRLVFLPTTRADFEWLADYYLGVFPEGGPRAYRRLERALAHLADNPRLGKAIAQTDYREYSVPRTPFALIYRIGDDAIEILRVWDRRADPAHMRLPDDGET